MVMKPRGVRLSFICSTLSYPRGGQIKSDRNRLRTPTEARAALKEFTKVAEHLIKEAERQERDGAS